MRSALTLVAVLGGAFAAPSQRVALEADVKIEAYSADWVDGGRADAGHTLEMTFAVKQRNVEQLAARLMDVSDPDSPRYGQHLTKEQVDRLVAPAASSVQAVQSFLASFDVSTCRSSANSDAIVCDVAVSVAEQMLGVEYHTFYHSKVPLAAVRATTHYTVPAELAAHLDLVSPTNRFPVPRPELAQRDGRGPAPSRTNTPASLRDLYNVGDVEGSAASNRLACTAFLKQYYKPKDLTKFWAKYYPKANGRKINVVGKDGLFPGIEASLDIEYISTMGGGVPAEFWTFDGSAPDNKENEPFLTWILLVGNTSDGNVPKVFSTSYGEPEATVSLGYMARIEAEFIKTGSRGITLFFASGDAGVANDDGQCPNGRFAGQWPAGSPWVTGVGGTEGGSDTVAEDAWGGSSGGFSDRWPRAYFQKDAVESYLSMASLPAAAHFNSTGRGFPDVSAQATSFLVINGGSTQGVAGTSCASPTFTGVFALLNDLRLAKGKSTLGFVNPVLYKNPSMFNDIVSGNNGAGGSCGEKGFDAIKGWDPVTGLGTPDYKKMAAVVNALP